MTVLTRQARGPEFIPRLLPQRLCDQTPTDAQTLICRTGMLLLSTEPGTCDSPCMSWLAALMAVVSLCQELCTPASMHSSRQSRAKAATVFSGAECVCTLITHLPLNVCLDTLAFVTGRALPPRGDD